MIHVLYGSQTGNCEEIAKRISIEVKTKLNLDNELSVLNSFLKTIQTFPERKNEKFILICIISSTGNGDPPINAEAFMRWIKRKTHTADLLSNVYYTILGLGDSNYSMYQSIPRQLDGNFQRIGGVQFYRRGEADDAYGLEGEVEPWIEGLFHKLNELKLNIGNTPTITNTNTNTPTTAIMRNQPGEEKECDMISTSSMTMLRAQVVSKRKISGKKSQREIFSMVFKIQEAIENYEPGAYISFVPPTPLEIISLFNTVVVLKDQVLLIDKIHHFQIYSEIAEKYPHFRHLIQQGYLTRTDIVTYLIDFTSILSISQAEILKALLHNKLSRFPQLLSKYDIALSKYNEIIFGNKIALFDIIQSLSMNSIQLYLSLSEIMDYFPMKYPRQYSLLSYYPLEKDHLEIVFSVVTEKIHRRKTFELLGLKEDEYEYHGLSTHFLKNIQEGQEIVVTAPQRDFKFPLKEFLDDRKPIVYACNGTGIGPCISFLKQICDKVNSYDNKLIFPEMLVLTGVRSAGNETTETIYEDFIFDAIKYINNQGGRISYIRCLSKSDDCEEEEIGQWRNLRINSEYVQDLIIEHSEKVFDLLVQQDGYFLICGSIGKIYEECIDNLRKVFVTKSYTISQSLRKIEEMKSKGRIAVEKWN